MSENTQNQKVIVVANLKSPVIGFVLALFLGWLGVDRFYSGGVVNIVFGIIKLIFFFVASVSLIVAPFSLMVGDDVMMYAMILYGGYIALYVLELIFVPLGISLDNRKKLSIAQGGNQTQEKTIAKSIGKVLSIIIRIALVIVIVLLLAFIAFAFI